MSAPLSPPFGTFHEVAPDPQPHMQASCPLSQEMWASGLGLASPSEGELTLPVMEQGFLALPTTCVAGALPMLSLGPPSRLARPAALGLQVHPCFHQQKPLVHCPLSLCMVSSLR